MAPCGPFSLVHCYGGYGGWGWEGRVGVIDVFFGISLLAFVSAALLSGVCVWGGVPAFSGLQRLQVNIFSVTNSSKSHLFVLLQSRTFITVWGALPYLPASSVPEKGMEREFRENSEGKALSFTSFFFFCKVLYLHEANAL